MIPRASTSCAAHSSGGTTACVIAGRLIDAATRSGTTLTVLILEQGPDTLDDPVVIQPARFMENLMPTSSRTLFYVGEHSEALGRKPVVPSGGCVGGGSAINCESLMLVVMTERG